MGVYLLLVATFALLHENLVLSFSFQSTRAGITRKQLHDWRSLRSFRTASERLSAVETDIDADTEQSEVDKLRKWYLINEKKRADVYSLESVSTVPQVFSEILRGVLISFRVLEKESNKDMRDHAVLLSFPLLANASTEVIVELQASMSNLERSMDVSSALFQPNLKRAFKLHFPKHETLSSWTLLVSIQTYRTSSPPVEIGDFDNDIPSINAADADLYTNDLPEFPFPTVYDFISEINRPPDPVTIANIRFKYSVKDLKYDIEKMKKKKNPQELVDSINCKLTRLSIWRDVLSEAARTGTVLDGTDGREKDAVQGSVGTKPRSEPDPFLETEEWNERVKLKYQSLKALINDPKKALDTQYDKRKTFIKIIDQWSDRLKRSFKFIYQSQREPEDFNVPILKSKWRNEVLNTTRLLAQVPFIELGGPHFELGSPAPTFPEERYVLWEADYPAEVVLYEMIVWFRESKALQNSPAVQKAAGKSMSNWVLDSEVTQHTYSRGLITERVLADAWQGLVRWLQASSGSISPSSSPELLDSDDLEVSLSDQSGLLQEGEERVDGADHTEQFLSALHSINDFSREASELSARSVKEMYRDFHADGKEIVQWWTTLVRDLDLVEEIHNRGNRRKPGEEPWSLIMSQVVEGELGREVSEDGDDPGRAAYAEKNGELWQRLKGAMLHAEKLQNFLKHKDQSPEKFNITALAAVSSAVDFNQETVHIDLRRSSRSAQGAVPSYLFVAPRYFRGIGMDEELSAFLEFVKVFSSDVKALLSPDVEVIAMHPQMVFLDGTPDYLRRTPHPAILVRLK